jgi:hypothetical protein
MLDYDYNPVPNYISKRRTFVWTRSTPAEVKDSQLKKAAAVVITLPPPEDKGIAAIGRRIRGAAMPTAENWDWLTQRGFQEIARTDEYVVYGKTSPP